VLTRGAGRARQLRFAHGGPRAVNKPETTIFVVDDDPSIREGLISLLRSTGYRVVAFASGNEFLRQPRGDFPACLVLDVRLRDMDGFDVQRELLRRADPMPVIFITGHADIPMSVRAIKTGAIDFLAKPFGDEELLAAIRRALAEHEAALPEVQYTAEVRNRYATLTRREREIMQYVVQGGLNKQIAAALGTAEITIKVHRRRVMQKMRAASLPDLVRMGGKLGWTYPQG
jgi:FixJ family two-component response regulator